MQVGAIFPQTEIGADPGQSVSSCRPRKTWDTITCLSQTTSWARTPNSIPR